MLHGFREWLARRRLKRRRYRADAQRLAASDPINAYYEAQRLSARARAAGDLHEFLHWARVAAEVARIEARVEMDFKVVQAIADAEMQAGNRFSHRSI